MIVYEPALAEDVVHLASCDNPSRVAEYRALQEEVYGQPPDKRHDAFYGVHRKLMRHWGLDTPLDNVAAEFHFPDGNVSELLVARARSSGEEGADLSWDTQRLGVKVRAERFLDQGALAIFLRHEFMHVSDMLDDDFGYQPERLDLTPSQEAQVRERYGLLWDISIESRLAAMGKETTASHDTWETRFGGRFTSLPAEQRSLIFGRIWDSPPLRHREILEKAIDPARFLGADTTPAPRTPGTKCPLCSFPSYQWVDAPSPALDAVKADFPHWQPEQGMCPRCGEYYAMKVGIW